VASSRLDTFFVVHFEVADGVTEEIDEEDGVEAVPGFAAFVVVAHASKCDGEPVFVEDSGVVAAGPVTGDVFNPGVAEE
jgi:hypothetical protein